MFHPIDNLEGYFDDDDKARFTATIREIAENSEGSIVDILSFVTDLIEADPTLLSPLEVLVPIRLALEAANKGMWVA